MYTTSWIPLRDLCGAFWFGLGPNGLVSMCGMAVGVCWAVYAAACLRCTTTPTQAPAWPSCPTAVLAAPRPLHRHGCHTNAGGRSMRCWWGLGRPSAALRALAVGSAEQAICAPQPSPNPQGADGPELFLQRGRGAQAPGSRVPCALGPGGLAGGVGGGGGGGCSILPGVAVRPCIVPGTWS